MYYMFDMGNMTWDTRASMAGRTMASDPRLGYDVY